MTNSSRMQDEAHLACVAEAACQLVDVRYKQTYQKIYSPWFVEGSRLGMAFLGVDSSFCSAIILCKIQPFPQGFWWFSRNKDP